jgi:hypothetical protein
VRLRLHGSHKEVQEEEENRFPVLFPFTSRLFLLMNLLYLIVVRLITSCSRLGQLSLVVKSGQWSVATEAEGSEQVVIEKAPKRSQIARMLVVGKSQFRTYPGGIGQANEPNFRPAAMRRKQVSDGPARSRHTERWA